MALCSLPDCGANKPKTLAVGLWPGGCAVLQEMQRKALLFGQRGPPQGII